ncbi:tRNA (adenosine(37)-N6)-threonylcarbamoyltransferase complex dimerization subunit type 1 TsaB [Magnetococcales bacterium HHB-1]
MKILAMDTAFIPGGIALLNHNTFENMALLTQPRGHVVSLPETLAKLMQQSDWHSAEIDCIAITHGPGSFVGLRVAMGVAKGINLVHKTPILALSTLEVAAFASGEKEAPIMVIQDARQGKFFAAIYQWYHRDLHLIQKPQLWTLDAFIEMLNRDYKEVPYWHFSGDGSDLFRADLEYRLGERYQPGYEDILPARPTQLATLARHRFLQGESHKADRLEPFYIRQPDAVEKRKEKQENV